MATRHALSVLCTSVCRPAVTSTSASQTHILRRAFTDQATAVDAPAEEREAAAEAPQTKYPDLDIEALLQDLGEDGGSPLKPYLLGRPLHPGSGLWL